VGVFEREHLDNGVRILTARMPHSQSTAVYLGFAVGARFETSERRGIAHFVEHMLFTGTERRPTMTALSGEVDALGAQFNAVTRKESTAYYVRCTSEHVDRALDILVDMARNSTFEPSEVEREKGVITEEMKMVYQSPREYVDENFEALLYGDTPLGRNVLGTEETVSAADRDSLVGFVQEWYTAPRIVVGIAGGVEADQRGRIEELLGDVPAGNGAVTVVAPVELDGRPQRVAIEQKDTKQAEIVLGAPSFPLDHPDRFAVAIVRAVLGGGMSSRLTRELVSGLGLAYNASAIVAAYADAGSIWAQSGVNAEKADEAVSTIVRELRRLAEEPVPPEELDKAKNYARGRFVFEIETPRGLMNNAIRRELVEGEAPEPEEILAGLAAVTAEDVQRVAREIFAPGSLRLAVIGPFDDAARFEEFLAG
jgi:predicted Zn-dependent peptidase